MNGFSQIAIAHAGGEFSRMRYSNSQESVYQSSRHTRFLELDLCLGLDAVLVAHDGLENRYGLQKKFQETTEAEFTSLRYKGKLTPFSLSELLRFGMSKNLKLIMDIKEEGDKYKEVLRILTLECTRNKNNTVIPQVYSKEDVEHAALLGYSSVMFATWKKFHRNPLDRSLIECLRDSKRDFPGGLMISIPFISGKKSTKWILEEDAQTLRREFSIFIHGQKTSDDVAIVSNGFNLFTHRPDLLEFASL